MSDGDLPPYRSNCLPPRWRGRVLIHGTPTTPILDITLLVYPMYYNSVRMSKLQAELDFVHCVNT